MVEERAKQLAILLVKTVQPDLQIVSGQVRAEACLSTSIARGAMFSGDDGVGQCAVVIGCVAMEERRQGQQQFRVESVHPGEIYDRIGFMIAVTQSQTGILSREFPIDQVVFDIERVGIVRNLVVILAERSYETELIRGIEVKDQRAESAVPIFSVVHHLRHRRLYAEIAAVGVDAGIVSEPFRMAAEVERIVRLIEIACADYQFRLAIALETGTRHNIEYPVGAIAKFRAVASAIDFKIVDIFRIELRPEIRSDIGIRHGNAVNKPTGLVSTPDVQLIVSEISPRNVVRNHRQAVGARGTRSMFDVVPADQRRGSGRVGWNRLRRSGNLDRFLAGGDS